MRTITLLLFPVSIGLIIGGAVAGNPMWIVGLILLIVDSVVGITIQYRIDNPSSSSGSKRIDNTPPSSSNKKLDYNSKIIFLNQNRFAKLFFTGSEIVSNVINYGKAQAVLTPREYTFISVLAEKFKKECDILFLSYEDFNDVFCGFLSMIDFIAPIQKYTDNQLALCLSEDVPEKQVYRTKANQLFEKMLESLKGGGLDSPVSDEYYCLYNEFRTLFWGE